MKLFASVSGGARKVGRETEFPLLWDGSHCPAFFCCAADLLPSLAKDSGVDTFERCSETAQPKPSSQTSRIRS